MIYFFIFSAKLLENAISTLRLIVVSSGKKIFGAILNLIVSIIWIFSTSLAIINIKDTLNIIAFALGSFIGSYIGSIIEEKIAIGSNMLFIVTKKEITIKEKLDELKYTSFIINDDIILIMVDRKKRKNLLNIIRKIDSDSTIISDKAKQLIFK
mgnify:CR=1 FL=1